MRFIDLTGQTFGFLKVEELLKKEGKKHFYKCTCAACGKSCVQTNVYLRSNKERSSCGCQKKSNFIDISGSVIGQIKVLRCVSRGTPPQHFTRWECECLACGKIFERDAISLRQSKKQEFPSCGCVWAAKTSERNKEWQKIGYINHQKGAGSRIKWKLSAAESELAAKYIHYVEMVAWDKFKSKDEDLISSGFLGLISAAHHYLADEKQDVCSFSTFAWRRIWFTMQKFRNQRKTDKVNVILLKKIERLYYCRTGKKISKYDLGLISGIDENEIRSLFHSEEIPVSFAFPIFIGDEIGEVSKYSIGDMIADQNRSPLDNLILLEQLSPMVVQHQRQEKLLEIQKLKEQIAIAEQQDAVI